VLAGIDNRVAATIHGRNAVLIDLGETHDRVSQHDFKDSPPEFSATVKTRLETWKQRDVHVITTWGKKLQRI
jgi:hypothetical protein